ncbi:MAG: hypothetical protein M3O71_23065 [Bacteroidota bacterium]|nr:hypothetical protein [Bacteroidota bacterium]
MQIKNEKHQAGILEQFTYNKHNDINGLIISENGDQLTVKFPPHIAEQVMNIVNPGDLVELLYNEHSKHKDSHRPERELEIITNKGTGKSVTMAESPAPKPVDSVEVFEFEIAHPELCKGKKEEFTGIKLDDKFIHLKSHDAEPLRKHLLLGTAIKVKAKRRLENLGFVNVSGLKVYHATAIEF